MAETLEALRGERLDLRLQLDAAMADERACQGEHNLLGKAGRLPADDFRERSSEILRRKNAASQTAERLRLRINAVEARIQQLQQAAAGSVT